MGDLAFVLIRQRRGGLRFLSRQHQPYCQRTRCVKASSSATSQTDEVTSCRAEHYKDVISIVFAYIDLLRRTPPQQWAFDEIRRLGQIGWRWKEKGQPQSATRNLASQLGETLYPPEKQLVGPWFATHWDEQLIRQMLDRLRLDNCRIFVGSQQPIVGRDFWQSTEQVSLQHVRNVALDVLT